MEQPEHEMNIGMPVPQKGLAYNATATALSYKHFAMVINKKTHTQELNSYVEDANIVPGDRKFNLNTMMAVLLSCRSFYYQSQAV